jgi:regulator of sirC expression with transglutaminase-like and TPR domain
VTAADRLTALLSHDDAVPLDESLLLLAAARPGSTADVAAGIAILDDLAAACPAPTVDALIPHLFEREGFDGDRHDYHDPRNSYLDEVLHRRVGMPITLGVVLVEVGRRLGIDLVGVGMPGHFLVRERGDTDGFIDPYHRGTRISAAACEARFRALHGSAVVFHPSYLDPVAPRSIVQRVLNNLTVSFRARSPRELEWLLDIRVRIPADPPELRALAELCELRGRYDAAADLLDRAVAGNPVEPTSSRVRERASRLRARLN